MLRNGNHPEANWIMCCTLAVVVGLTCNWLGDTLVVAVLNRSTKDRAMRSTIPLAFFLFVASTLAAQKISTYDIPGGTNATPTGISSSGEIIGSYMDTAANKIRGFLRQPNGTITVFDFPNGMSTLPTAINSGLIVGSSQEDPLLGPP